MIPDKVNRPLYRSCAVGGVCEAEVGFFDGDFEGGVLLDGASEREGLFEGVVEGDLLGLSDGLLDGLFDGFLDGLFVADVGLDDIEGVSESDGDADGDLDGA
jgi:hypothetical protein